MQTTHLKAALSRRAAIVTIALAMGTTAVAQTPAGAADSVAAAQPATTAVPTTVAPAATPADASLQFRFIGFLSHDSALTAMADYVIVQRRLADLQRSYDEELRRAEEEFNQKYEDFLDGRADFPRTILLKRQTELQQLLERNVAFKEQARQEMAESRERLLLPLRQRLSAAIAVVARRHGLAVVVNTDNNATLYIDPDTGVDISAEVAQLLSR